MSLEDMLERIATVAGQRPYASDSRSLLHAYSACLTSDDLCASIALTLGAPADVRLALRGRLLRTLGDHAAPEQRDRLVDLVAETSALSDGDKGLRQTVDALHSAMLRHLPIPTQHQILERWVDRGTRGAMARWLKAARDTPTLFDASVALAYWRATRDYRAAKSLAYQAEPDALGPIVSELVAQCEEGWIISKAILRSGCDDETTWDLVRSNHPATYLYLCANYGGRSPTTMRSRWSGHVRASPSMAIAAWRSGRSGRWARSRCSIASVIPPRPYLRKTPPKCRGAMGVT